MLDSVPIDYAFISKLLNGAIKTVETYPPGHPTVEPVIEKCFSAIRKAFNSVDHLTITQMENRIVINGKSIEGTYYLKKLLEEFNDQNINSLSFTNSLTRDEFAAFLGFFAKPTPAEALGKSLTEFLEMKQIHSINVDRVRYELVSTDEVVVKSEVLEGADLKVQISKIIRENPDLVRDILLNKQTPVGAIEEKFGPVNDLRQLSDQIQNELKELTEDDLMHLLASGLKQNLNKLDLFEENSSLNEMVVLVYKLMEDEDKRRLLPQIKSLLANRGIVEKKHLDLIFDEKWLISQSVLDELAGMIEKLGIEEVDMEKLMFLWHRVLNAHETDIKTYAANLLISRLDSENSETRKLASKILKGGLNRIIQEGMEPEFDYIMRGLSEKFKGPLPASVLEDFAEIWKVIFSERMKRGEFKEALFILTEYNNRMSSEIAYPVGVKEVVSRFIRDNTDEPMLSLLVGYIKEGVPMNLIKQVEEIFECLAKDKVAEKLLTIFTSSDRATRMSALRVLSRLGENSIQAISSFVSNEASFVREKENEHLNSDSWYKMRNAIYVLGNIPDDKCIQVLSQLSRDPDFRVRLEVVKVLEKLNRVESVNILLDFLSDPEDEVRRSAITSLGLLSDAECLDPLLEHFRRHSQDKLTVLNAIGKIGGKETIGEDHSNRIIKFLLAILSDEEPGIKHLPPKPKDEIQIAALSVLGKIGSPDCVDEIEKFIRKKKKGFKGLLVNDRLIETAHRTVKLISGKENHRSRNEKSGMALQKG